MDEMKQMVAMTALNKMMVGGHFSICTIDSIAEMLGVDPKGDAYRMLRPLHCVNFADMPSELKARVPGLIKECLGVEPIYQFALPAKAVVVSEPSPESQPKRGLMRLLAR